MPALAVRLTALRTWGKTTRQRFIRWCYRQFCRLPVRPHLVLCDAAWGGSYSCNPRGISEHLMMRRDPSWTLVWGFANPRAVTVPAGVSKVKYNGLAFHYVAARAGVLITNVNFADHIVKRPGSLHIQTMHGTPIKTLGLDIPGEFKSQKGRDAFLRRNRRWDYLTAPGQYTADCAHRAFQHRAAVLPFGYPRNDYLFSGNRPEEVRRLRTAIGIPEFRKVLLFAPTWRPTGSSRFVAGTSAFVECFLRNEALCREYVLLLRYHHLTKVDRRHGPGEGRGQVIDVSEYPDNRELMLIADALVTDYSSIVFDFALLERPVALFCFDYDHYVRESRGVYMDIVKESPWPTYLSAEQLADRLQPDLAQPLDLDAHRRFVARYCEWEHGDAARRLCDEVLAPWRRDPRTPPAVVPHGR